MKCIFLIGIHIGLGSNSYLANDTDSGCNETLILLLAAILAQGPVEILVISNHTGSRSNETPILYWQSYWLGVQQNSYLFLATILFDTIICYWQSYWLRVQ